MTDLLTAAQMRTLELAAIASGRVTGHELMERAGRGVVEAIFQEWPALRATSHRAVVLCGPGNNGGDGFVVARLLKGWGWDVAVFLHGDPEKMPPDARVNCERWLAIGPIAALDALDWPLLRRADITIDALFGIGLQRPLAAGLWGALDMAQEAGTRLIAIDLPSGLCAESGRMRVEGIGPDHPADLTITFHSRKPGHLLAEGPMRCGRLVVASIGLEATADRLSRDETVWSPVEGTTVDPGALAKGIGHKFTHGHALILSGPPGHGGAARLTARGSLRIGAGLVTLGCPPDALPETAARLDAVMLRPIADADVLARVLEDRRINALCVGPGLGTGEREAGLVTAALAAARALVLDADALTILSQRPDLFASLPAHAVLTPHAGEFARLFPDIAGKLVAPAANGPAFSKLDATREAAKRAGCVVLFKGPDTVIATPTGRCAINAAAYDRAAPWLATAGSGDVLAGFITGLLARGFSPFDAACTGAWLHVEAARSFGPGLIAEDLPEELPKAFRALGI